MPAAYLRASIYYNNSKNVDSDICRNEWILTRDYLRNPSLTERVESHE
jgi:hypothetical protein